ncbi:MAG: SWIM zinc finger family protein [Phormidesmis sp.]
MTYTTPQPAITPEDAWWVQQWVDLLNSYRFKKRLERGRNYARQGHILSLEFKNSKVHAQVQGTATEPYQLSIWIERFTDEDWGYVIDTLGQKALYSAQLLAGEMPDNIEEVFTSNGLSLFPFTLADVNSKCSCPDPKNPCKHIAAVYYQLGDFFREDPFVLFQLRGRTKEQILDALRQQRQQAIIAQAETAEETAEATEKAPTDTPSEQPKAVEDPITPSQLAAKLTGPAVDIEKFWQYDASLDPSLVVITPAEQTVLDVIGELPLASTEAQIIAEHFKTLYQAVAQQAMMTALS